MFSLIFVDTTTVPRSAELLCLRNTLAGQTPMTVSRHNNSSPCTPLQLAPPNRNVRLQGFHPEWSLEWAGGSICKICVSGRSPLLLALPQYLSPSFSFLMWSMSIASEEEVRPQCGWIQTFPIAPQRRQIWGGWRGSCTFRAGQWTATASIRWRGRCCFRLRDPSVPTYNRFATLEPDATSSQLNAKLTNEAGPHSMEGCAHRLSSPPSQSQGLKMAALLESKWFVIQARSGYRVQFDCSKIRSETGPASRQAGGVSLQTWQEPVSFHLVYFFRFFCWLVNLKIIPGTLLQRQRRRASFLFSSKGSDHRS